MCIYRHLSETVSNYRAELAMGEISVLRKWCISEELNLIKSFIKLSIPEAFIEPALRVLFSYMQAEGKLSCRCGILSLEIEELSQPPPEPWRAKEISEEKKEFELSLQNYDLEPVKERVLSSEELKLTKEDLAKNKYLQITICYLEQELENAEKRHLRMLAEKEGAQQAKLGKKKVV